jgi:RHS repeat-associated protein
LQFWTSLQWLISDNLGSTSVTTNSDGTFNSEIRYTAFGEIRWKNGITPTNYRYTGQLDDSYIKLDWFNSRWYDSQLARFVQPDSIIPSAGSVKSFDHYAYALNNPIRYNDPTGHDVGMAAAGFTSQAYMYYSGYSSYYPSQIYVHPQPSRSVFVGSMTSTPVNQFAQDFNGDKGKMICGIVAPNGINGKTWNDIGQVALKNGFTNDKGLQPSQEANTLKEVFGAKNVVVHNNWSPEGVYDALASNHAVIIDMLIKGHGGGNLLERTFNPLIYTPASSGESDTESHFARVIGMDWNKQQVYIQNTLPGNETWVLKVDELEKSWYNPEKEFTGNSALSNNEKESVGYWGVAITQH